nr:NADH-quinone oxidoreductase subunit I [Microbispora rosea]
MGHIPGEGLAKGPAVTMRHMLRESETRQYPEVRPDLPARSRGVIALVEENCTVCMLCARECPDWCIYIDSHKETLPAPEGGRPRARNVLDRFAIDFSLCMYCGICIEVCPFDALFWSPEFEYAEYDIRDLLHEKDRLSGWAATVPPPPAHEAGAEPPKELAAGSRPASAARRTAPPARVQGPAEGASAAQEAARETAAPEAGRDTTRGTAREAAGRPAAEPVKGPVGRPRREPPRVMRDIRSIRPPGSLPKKTGPSSDKSPEKKDGPEGER